MVYSGIITDNKIFYSSDTGQPDAASDPDNRLKGFQPEPLMAPKHRQTGSDGFLALSDTGKNVSILNYNLLPVSLLSLNNSF